MPKIPLGRFDESGPILLAAALALALALALLAHVATLFQNLYQSSFILLRGVRVAHTYWASVSYGLTMAVLVGALCMLLAVIIALELVRHARRRF